MTPDAALVALGWLGDRLSVASGLEAVVDTALEAVEQLLGHPTSLLLVYQPELDRLVTLASRGYDTGGIGSEVALAEGVIGMAAARRRAMRIGNLQRMLSYARTVQRSASEPNAGDEIRLPGLADAGSQMAAPLVARGVLLGVLAVETRAAGAYDEVDERVIALAAHLIGAALEREQLVTSEPEPPAPATRAAAPAVEAPAPLAEAAPVTIRHYAVDGSTFLNGSYVIKGVAGRLLWKLLSEHAATGRTSFTNREAKLDPVLELPGFRDNFESRLILLKRRLAERGAPVRVTSTGRGRFELDVTGTVALEHVPS
jgi:adenylate cyclase